MCEIFVFNEHNIACICDDNLFETLLNNNNIDRINFCDIGFYDIVYIQDNILSDNLYLLEYYDNIIEIKNKEEEL